MTRAHRVALALKLGRALRDGEVARHSNRCTTRACCNQDHLSEGTQADNARDMVEAGRSGRGERNVNGKLTAAQVLDIRSRHDAGESGHRIARALGVSASCVYFVLQGRTWKHVAPAADEDPRQQIRGHLRRCAICSKALAVADLGEFCVGLMCAGGQTVLDAAIRLRRSADAEVAS